MGNKQRNEALHFIEVHVCFITHVFHKNIYINLDLLTIFAKF